MTPLQAIETHGWITGGLQDDRGVCLIGACRLADYGYVNISCDPLYGTYETAARQLHKRRYDRNRVNRQWSTVEDWNDSGVNLSSIKSFLKRVQRLVNRRMPKTRSPLTTTTQLTIPSITVCPNPQPPTAQLCSNLPWTSSTTTETMASVTIAAASIPALNQTQEITCANLAPSPACLVLRKLS